jgi:glycopeptide antibiotics resistance protein
MGTQSSVGVASIGSAAGFLVAQIIETFVFKADMGNEMELAIITLVTGILSYLLPAFGAKATPAQ